MCILCVLAVGICCASKRGSLPSISPISSEPQLFQEGDKICFFIEALSSFQTGALCPLCAVCLTHAPDSSDCLNIDLVLSRVFLPGRIFEKWAQLIAGFLMRALIYLHTVVTAEQEVKQTLKCKVKKQRGKQEKIDLRRENKAAK